MLVFSTHAFTEGDVLSSFFGWLYAISTHAFTEGDGVQLKRKFYWKRISTHAFTEGDISSIPANSSSSSFQLTPSRKATFFWRLEFWHVIISTHAFTEGDSDSSSKSHEMLISTHAFTEGDVSSSLALSIAYCISTHAFTEGDWATQYRD